MAESAVILAAGAGSRLRPETDSIPKCLLAVGSETFLTRLLRQYSDVGISHVTVVAGYRAAEVSRVTRQHWPHVEVVENRLYDRTNNMFSLALALGPQSGDLIFGNADVVYADEVFADFVTSAPTNSIAVEVGSYLDESMKVELHQETGRIVRIAKDVPRSLALGNSADIYKLSAPTVAALRALIFSEYLEAGRLNEWSERVLNALFSKHEFQPWRIAAKSWVEVDTHEDLRQARELVGSGDG